MVFAVSREKGDRLAADFADRYLIARRAVRGLDPDFSRTFEQRIKTGSAKDADLGSFFR
jgi:hypothetical protein